MLSYRHSYHAGNFADVFKHVVLTSALTYLVQKDRKLCYIDTHAGAGTYDLRSPEALKTAENALGIAQLRDAVDAPQPVATYLELVREFNAGNTLAGYPGSPWLAASILRPADRLILCEAHPSDLPKLQQQFARDRRVYCHAEDSYRFAPGLVPPIERRGLIFMDPSFELEDEYDTAVNTIKTMHRRFATGSYALWYPIINERISVTLEQQLKASGIRDILHLALRVADARSYSGMYGCGMILINPPWTLRGEMELALPYLCEKLAQDKSASFAIEQWAEE